MKNNIKETVIATTPYYKMVLGNGIDGGLSYLIVNKEFGVIEAESTILAQAFAYLEEMDTALKAHYDMNPDSKITIH